MPFLPLWKDADIWPQVTFKKLWMEGIWAGLFIALDEYIDGGYDAVGDFTYFGSDHKQVDGAVVQLTAMPAVVKALEDEKFGEIASAHSAVHSYLPCFP